MSPFHRCLAVVSSWCGWCDAMLVLNAWNYCMNLLFGLVRRTIAGK